MNYALALVNWDSFVDDYGSLHAENKNLDSLNGVENMKSLELSEIYMSNNQLENIDKLKYFSSVYSLDLTDNKIKNIDSLRYLADLNSLFLSSNLIENIDGLASLYNLDTLILNNNKIKSLKPFQNLTLVSYLSLYQNMITDLNGIENFFNLYYLYLDDNQIESIESLKNLSQLSVLSLSNNNISSIDCLGGLKNLEELYLVNNRIKSIYVLKQLDRFLNWIKLEKNQIDSVDEIKDANPEMLGLAFNKINDSLNFNFKIYQDRTLIDLKYNEISGIDADFYTGSTLQVIFLSNNKIKSLKSDNFGEMNALYLINLDNNLIEDLNPGAFNGLTSLNYISLKNNSITKIPDDLFASMNQTNRVALNRNNISELSLNSFKNVNHLQIDYELFTSNFKNYSKQHFSFVCLDLSQQAIEKLFSNTLKGLFSKLILENNLIKEFEANSFADLNNLVEISFSNNLIQSLNFQSAFAVQSKSIRTLSFDSNKIESIDPAFFSKFPALQTLNLSNNNFMSIKKDFFINTTTLVSLDLGKNQILLIEPSSYDKLKLLNSLILNNNLLYFFPIGLFKYLNKLKRLDLGKNKLEFIENFYFDGLIVLEVLDLSGNQIQSLFTDSFRFIPKMLDLNLNGNKIKELNGSLKYVPLITKLDLSSNQLSSILNNQYSFTKKIQYLDLSYNNFKFIDKNLSSLYNLKTLKLCQIGDLVSSFSFNYFKKLEELDLSFNNLTSPLLLFKPELVKKINLSHTLMNDYGFLENFVGLIELDLNGNNITNVFDISIFGDLTLLKIAMSDIGSTYFKYTEGCVSSFSHLDLSVNNLIKLPYCDGFADLVHLDISLNEISGFESENDQNLKMLDLYFFKSLKFLNASKGLKKNLAYYAHSFRPRLETLIFRGNHLRIFPSLCEIDSQDPFEECQLSTLDLGENEIDTLRFVDFLYLINLKYLSLDNNKIKNIEDGTFSNMAGLETLILSNNQLNNMNDINTFNYLTSLTHLSLKSNKIERLNPFMFDNLLKLKLIDLSFNSIYEIGDYSFNKLSNLRELYINNQISDSLNFYTSSLSGLDSIQSIYLSKDVLVDDLNADIFIKMADYKNSINNKVIVDRLYYKSFNLISFNETDCDLTIKLIRFNIHFNLKTEYDFNNYVSMCESISKENLNKTEDINYFSNDY